MKLNYNEIKDITVGAALVEERDGGVGFSRFTKEQRTLYCNRTEACYLRSLSMSGIKLCFRTDSQSLGLSLGISPATSRKYYAVDILVDGEYIGGLNNFEGTELPQKYTVVDLKIEDAEKTFDLGNGEKLVEIYLPWSANAVIKELSLDDGAYINPVKREKKLLAFGDSITQGYDALHPINSYVARLAKALGADEYNKGIGGEIFFPELALTKEEFTPDYITVAYGTNDWSICEKDVFRKNCSEFYSNLRKTYPDVKIFAITPVWRTDINGESPMGKFDVIENTIKSVAEKLGITVISGVGLIPPEETLFADLFVHPSDEGFKYYYENLYKKMKEKGDLR